MMKATTINKFDHFTKRLWVVFAFILFTIHGALAQCPPGDVTLNTQAQVDNFIVQYPGCTVITGNVSILDELAESGITNLNGLRNITSITGDLVVFGNVNLDGLPALSHIGGSLHILQNQKLQNINGFAALTSIGGRISISQNRALTKLDGFAALTDIGGYVSISENHALTNIDGFAALTEIGAFLSISKNHALTNIDGFAALTTIGSLVSISENQALTNINGFAALTTIDGEVWINQNLVLTEISGLQNIDPATIRGLSITGNILLSVCNLPNICAYLANDPATHPRTISGNAGACGDEAAIIAACNAATAGCPIGHLTFTSQAAIDQFILDYPTCTEITGNITISGNDITNLDGLRNIISITGHLDVLSNAALVNLDGFAALTTIGGFVSINLNPALNKIDGFATLKTIGGEVFIAQNQTLTNIDGFAALTTIGGPLQILENQALTKIDGFSTLTTIGGFLSIDRNRALTNIDGFEALKTIGGELTINTNTALTNIDGFAALTDIGGYLLIGFNPALINIDGFSALETIDGDVFISQNQALTKIDGFAALTTIGGSLSIYQNQALTDISALQNIDPSTIRGLSITGNILLSVCNLPNFCTYLANDRATHPRAIIGNAGDCGDEAAIIAACNGATTGCPTGDLTFDSQAAIDQFIIDYPSCTEITGNVTISGEDITNLDGLRNITNISGFLRVESNRSLTSINGLSALTTVGSYVWFFGNWYLTNLAGLTALTEIGGQLWIDNNGGLTSLEGMNNLTSVGGNITIVSNDALTNIDALTSLTSIGGALNIWHNPILSDLSGLANITSIGGGLSIENNTILSNLDGLEALTSIVGFIRIDDNAALTDISALQNIDPSTFWNLFINNNPLLSICNLPNICTYLANDRATHPRTISGNAGACGDEAAIIAACNGAAAGCPIGDVILNTQAEVDNFIIQYPDCTVITGNVTIESSPHFQQNMITNLDGLRNITSIEGNLSIGSYRNENVIQFSQINNLNGLSNLTSVGGNLIIKQDIGLVNIDGLSSLTFVGGDMDIFSIHSLTTIDGFSALTAIGGDIRIRQNPALTKIDGFAALTTIGGDIRIDQNQALMDIDGFAALTTIGGGIRLNENQALTNIDEFAALTTIGGDIWIYRTALTKIDGFATLTTIGGDFTISQNQTLTNIDGFAALTSIGRGLYFISNPVLGNINGFTALTTIGGFLDFSQSQALTKIDGFAALTTIGTGLSIYQNQALTDISALQNIDISTIENLFIIDNPLLSVCNLPNICTYLANDPVTHPRAISGNAGNCGDEAAIIAACNAAATGCPTGDLTFTSQAALDQFIIDYPSCTEITGNVTIANIFNLEGLRNITSISGGLAIAYSALINLDELSALRNIGGALLILQNQALTNIDGFTALTSIGGNVEIRQNPVLTKIDGFAALTSIGGGIRLSENQALTNIDGFSALTTVGGDVWIYQNQGLTNIDGFAALTSIGGEFIVNQNQVLTKIDRFSALTTIGGNTWILENQDLTSIDGLTALTSIGGELNIVSNPVLSSINGITALTTIGGTLQIYQNPVLANMDGFAALTTVGGDLYIRDNLVLSNLNGFAALTSIGGYLQIADNTALTDISALQNIDMNSIVRLRISDNPVLSVCNLPNICAYLANDPATHPRTISGNAGDCGDEAAIIAACNGATAGCPIGNLILDSQAAIDQFIIDYPTCTEITGSVTIFGEDITNLDGLRNITNISAQFRISYAPALTSISGLAALTSIGGDFILSNTNLIHLNGLNALKSVGGQLNIAVNQSLISLDGMDELSSVGTFIRITYNDALTNIDALASLVGTISSLDVSDNMVLANLHGLANITSIRGAVTIENNDALISLNGFEAGLTNMVVGLIRINDNTALTDISALQNIDPSILRNLSINNNPLLSICNLPNICTYLANDPATHPRTISGNAGDCGDEAAIIAACNGCAPGMDSQAPEITCIGNQIVKTLEGESTYVHRGTDWDAVATDNCMVASVEYVLSGATTGNGASLDGVVFNAGLSTVSWTVTDGNGNTAVCSFTVTVEITELEIVKEDITGMTFANSSFVYDSTVKSLTITGDLPAGTSVSYTINGVPGNSATVVGSYALVANIAGGDNYHDLTLNATLEITKAAITGIDFANGSFVYDGTAKSLAITGSLPAGTSLSYLIDGSAANSVTNAGTYSVTANISGGDNYHDLTLTATLQITKANQQINHNIPAEVQRSAGSIPVSVTSSSGLTVSISEDDPQIARVIGNNLQILQMGTVRITLSQSGNENYQAAQPVTVTLRVVDMEEADLPVKIHQALSPNGDGINDQLIIEGIKDYPENKVTILSRNGTIVYQAERYNNDNIAFTGNSINGLKLPAGTYFYIVEIKVDGAWKYKKSFFVLRR